MSGTVVYIDKSPFESGKPLKCPPVWKITADTLPNVDERLREDCYWGAKDWIFWHGLNVSKYGKNTADRKAQNALNEAIRLGSVEQGYWLTNKEFQDYFKPIIGGSILQSVTSAGTSIITTTANTASSVAENLGSATTNVSKAADNLTDKGAESINSFGNVLKYAPWIIGGIAIVIIGAVIYVVVSERKSIIAKV